MTARAAASEYLAVMAMIRAIDEPLTFAERKRIFAEIQRVVDASYERHWASAPSARAMQRSLHDLLFDRLLELGLRPEGVK